MSFIDQTIQEIGELPINFNWITVNSGTAKVVLTTLAPITEGDAIYVYSEGLIKFWQDGDANGEKISVLKAKKLIQKEFKRRKLANFQ